MTQEPRKRREKEEEEKRDGFVFLPRWLFKANFLSGKDKLFCLTLAYHRNQHTKLCCPKLPTICSETHFSKPTILKIRRKLKKLGLINCKAGLGGKSYARYKLNWLDNSKQEIERLKEILKTKELVKKRTNRTDKKEKLAISKKQKPLLVKKRTTNNNKENNKKHQQEKEQKPKTDDDVSLFNILKPKILTTLKKNPFGLGEPMIIRLIKITKRKDINGYFSDWIEYILSDPTIKKPGPYFIKVIKEQGEPKPPLYLTRRVELFNSFTGKQVRAEKNVAFENMVEREVLEKANERIKEIPFIYNLKNQIERAKDPETKVRYQEREEQERQKAKTKLIHRICSLIKPSRLKMFRKKLVKLDPGNTNFKQAIARGYNLHTKRPYSDGFDEKVA